MNIPSPLLPVLQSTLNTVIGLDPEVKKILLELDQKVIQLHVRGLDMSVFLIIVDGIIGVSGLFDGEVDSTVSGTPFALGRLSIDTEGVFKGEIDIQGDIVVGRNVRRLFSEINIDWEDQFSKLIGDTTAHQLSRIQLELFKFISGTVTSFQQNTSEYLTEESRLVVNPSELGKFLDEVDCVRADVDRLEARVELLKHQASGGVD